LYRVAAVYRLRAEDLTGMVAVAEAVWAASDGEVFLDAVAQEQLVGWCRPGIWLGVPSFTAAPNAGRLWRGQAGWARWRWARVARTGLNAGGPRAGGAGGAPGEVFCAGVGGGARVVGQEAFGEREGVRERRPERVQRAGRGLLDDLV
jgi:hypothetical protein